MNYLDRAITNGHARLSGEQAVPAPSGVRAQAPFGELCKIIFVKISDEQAKRKKGEPYEVQIKTHEPNQLQSLLYAA